MSSALAVPYVNLAAQALPLRAELLAAVAAVLERGDFILGGAVPEFERSFAALCGTQHAVAVGNGTDALILALRAMGIGPGDEVITVSNSFIATAAAVALVSATAVLVDVREDMNMDPAAIEPAITPRTKALLPVHLTGRPCEMAAILTVADRHGLVVVEDASQAVGAARGGRRTGAFGRVGTFSLHPLKNLNALGDGGVLTTNDAQLADRLRRLRNHGLRNRDASDEWGFNSRLDTIQAAWLNIKLPHLEAWTETRRRSAAFYRERLADVVICPVDQADEYAVYHTFVIHAERRDELQRYLLDRGVETKVHYPIPIHRQHAARVNCRCAGALPMTERLASRILSLPIYPELTTMQKETVVKHIRAFYGR